ncbi:hypothetical protein [Glaciihabitans sp. dw_435]|uniref:hypothetical protein n=1 Tax=Glaciihabitans sp. dw_435 TaxID=2720081 RepID=UPI001BD1EF21|nr:hypothetical protein [Glaciihabitans sp. dw_435]
MRTLTRSAIVLSAAVALVGVSAVPAMAVDAPVAVAVEAGVLSITSDAIVMPDVAPGVASVSADFGVAVSDLRAQSALGWVTSVSMTQFVGTTTPANVISPALSTYAATGTAHTGTATITTAAAITDLTVATPIQTATAVTGNNNTTWNGSLSVAVPAAALADNYTATLTQSVL